MKSRAIFSACILVSACASTSVEPQPSQPNSSLTKGLSEQFVRVDFNGDGLITPYEHKESLKADFAKYYDTDVDGTLKLACTKADFSNITQNYGPLHPDIRQCLNTEVATVANYSFDDFFAAHAQWWENADANSDDFISGEEYAAAATAK